MVTKKRGKRKGAVTLQYPLRGGGAGGSCPDYAVAASL
ncbi:hypothetical protein EBBID32_5210 [Sphingobium indicum BiD32]|uniref:Uncharacterized protein n=1 Tax=Sphingobium indicum BiD32 TaxID=1301087 RepID=N1MHG6_9SPHN|nr:hypothetical protein EBBID32_5210 [Sphingobium indicum BiD32]